jgi:hypothetical protein
VSVLIVPYRNPIYDLAANAGWVRVRVDHDSRLRGEQHSPVVAQPPAIFFCVAIIGESGVGGCVKSVNNKTKASNSAF